MFFCRTKSPAPRRCLQTWYQIPTRLISCKAGPGTKTSRPPRAEVEFDVPHGSHANPGCLYSAWIRSYLLHLLFLIRGMHQLNPLHILWVHRPLWTLCRWALWSKVLILLLAEHLPESMRELWGFAVCMKPSVATGSTHRACGQLCCMTLVKKRNTPLQIFGIRLGMQSKGSKVQLLPFNIKVIPGVHIRVLLSAHAGTVWIWFGGCFCLSCTRKRLRWEQRTSTKLLQLHNNKNQDGNFVSDVDKASFISYNLLPS